MGMTPKAPHLPPVSCSVHTHNYMKSIRSVLLISVLSVFAGATAALVTIAWFMPVADTGVVYFGERPNSASPFINYNPVVERETRERLITVYDERELSYGVAYTQASKIGKAVLLSSDGWVVMSAPETAPPKQFIAGIDSSGGMHAAQHTVFDRERGLLYIKFDGNNFPVQSFADWSHIQAGKIVLIAHESWQVSRVRAYEKPVLMFNVWAHADRFSLEKTDAVQGSIIYDENGRFIGFVQADGLAQLGAPIQESFASVVEKQQVNAVERSWIGEFIEGYIDPKSETVIGKPAFIVHKVETGETELKVGDIITQINGRDIDVVSFARSLRSVTEPFTLTVVRNKQAVEIVVDSK